MKRFFKKFLCVVGLAVLSTVCAHAYDYTVLVDLDETQRAGFSRLLSQDSSRVFSFSSGTQEVRAIASVELLDEGRRFAVLVVKDANLENISLEGSVRLIAGNQGLHLGCISKIANAQTGAVRPDGVSQVVISPVRVIAPISQATAFATPVVAPPSAAPFTIYDEDIDDIPSLADFNEDSTQPSLVQPPLVQPSRITVTNPDGSSSNYSTYSLHRIIGLLNRTCSGGRKSANF